MEIANRAMDVLERENRLRKEIQEGSTLAKVGVFKEVREEVAALQALIMFRKKYQRLKKEVKMKRSHEPLSEDNLKEVEKHALKELDRFLNQAGNPKGKFKVYENKLIAICLCQGAGQHYADLKNYDSFDNEIIVSEDEIQKLNQKAEGVFVDEFGNVKSGIKDIDVWFFFEEVKKIKTPRRGKSLKENFTDIGRMRIDFFKKGIKKEVFTKDKGLDITEKIKAYIRYHVKPKYTPPPSAWYLSRKSIVGLYPAKIFGKVIWKVKRTIEKD